MVTKSVTYLLGAVLLAGCAAAHACESAIQMAIEDGKVIAEFKVGDSRCSLTDDRIRCTPVDK